MEPQMMPQMEPQMMPQPQMEPQPQMMPQMPDRVTTPVSNGVYPIVQDRMIPIDVSAPQMPTDATAQSMQWLKTKPNPDTVGLKD
jgi:hypothetical protein